MGEGEKGGGDINFPIALEKEHDIGKVYGPSHPLSFSESLTHFDPHSVKLARKITTPLSSNPSAYINTRTIAHDPNTRRGYRHTMACR